MSFESVDELFCKVVGADGVFETGVCGVGEYVETGT